MKNYKSSESIPDDQIPEQFSFNNIDGFDFTSQIRNQEHCGACYATSFVQVVEARTKLLYGKEAEALSTQFLLSCNYLNEGCEGGWPIFNGYLAENGYLISEECAPYLGKT